ncbi:MAG: hypothetical protein Kow0062_09800 [Acidobacteriota bacterium]
MKTRSDSLSRPRAALVGSAVVLALLAGPAARAASLDLNFVQFPERRSISLRFHRLAPAPLATVTGDVTFRDGQAEVEIAYKDMKPAILYGGDITCYVVWALTRDGGHENLGELIVEEDRGDALFRTAKKEFALVITAEPYYLVREPSDLVLYFNAKPSDRRAVSVTAPYSSFVQAADHAMDSIAQIAWDSDTPLELLQARKALELAAQHDAAKFAPDLYAEAEAALKSAEKERSRRKRHDFARRSVALSNEAINITARRLEEQELERRIAARRAEMNELEQRAHEAEQAAQSARESVTQMNTELAAARAERARLTDEMTRLEAERSKLQEQMTALRTQMQELEQQRKRLQQEKTELNTRLSQALSKVAETQQTVRGFVVNLPDILFDVNEASLKSNAKIVLAKLAGILLISPDLKVRVEGHTDSTGSEEYNLRLSQRRAESVVAFLVQEGVDPGRLEAVGYGMSKPIADNSTPEGRRKNRRVELIISDGR